MDLKITHRKAVLNDLKTIVQLLLDDELGQIRETLDEELDPRYVSAFHKIDKDPNHYLMVIEYQECIIGTCHLIITPSLTFTGQNRMQIEAVRIATPFRGQGIGEWMINKALDYAKSRKSTIIQLTTNQIRPKAKKFYEKLGFEATHIGMKLYFNQED